MEGVIKKYREQVKNHVQGYKLGVTNQSCLNRVRQKKLCLLLILSLPILLLCILLMWPKLE